MSGIATAGTLMLLMSAIADHVLAVVTVMMLAGIANGITAPSRDVLIRRAAVGAGMGSVFGFVYSGFDLGSSTAPLLFGALLDHQAPHAVFVAIACAFALAVPTVMEGQHRAAARPHLPACAGSSLCSPPRPRTRPSPLPPAAATAPRRRSGHRRPAAPASAAARAPGSLRWRARRIGARRRTARRPQP